MNGYSCLLLLAIYEGHRELSQIKPCDSSSKFGVNTTCFMSRTQKIQIELRQLLLLLWNAPPVLFLAAADALCRPSFLLFEGFRAVTDAGHLNPTNQAPPWAAGAGPWPAKLFVLITIRYVNFRYETLRRIMNSAYGIRKYSYITARAWAGWPSLCGGIFWLPKLFSWLQRDHV